MGITKLQKLAFLTEYFLSKKNKRASDYEFFMYDHGPMSKGVYDDFATLINEELIVVDEGGARLTELGESVYEEFCDMIPKDINSTMQHVTDNYAKMKTQELVETVHRMRIRLPDGIITIIDNIPGNTTVLPRPLKTSFNIQEYLETFRILYDKPLISALRKARKKGMKSKPYKPLLSSS